MIRKHLCVLVATAALAAMSVAHATSTSATINTEQKAAAALVTAFYLRQQAPWHVRALTASTQDIVARALDGLNAVSSPAAVMNAPYGIVVRCPVAGRFTARMARSYPRVLKLEWNACVFERFGAQHTINGPGEITLFNDSFAPSVVAGIRAGSQSRDLIDGTILGDSTQVVPDTVNHNFCMAGRIPMTRVNELEPFEGSFSYELTGFLHETTHFLVPGSEQLFAREMIVSAEHAYVSGVFNMTPSGPTSDLRISRGKFATWNRQPATPVESEFIDTSNFTAEDLHLVEFFDLGLGAEIFEIDGKTTVAWPADYDMACMNGKVLTYDTRVRATRVPGHPNNDDFYDAGELLINGTETAKFSLVGDPDVEQFMHVDLDVRRLGNFDYDVPGGQERWGDLGFAARCAH